MLMLGKRRMAKGQSPVLMMCQFAMPGTEVSVRPRVPGLETFQRAGCSKLYLGREWKPCTLVWPFIGIFCSNWVTRAPGKFHQPWEGNLWDPRFKSRKGKSTSAWGAVLGTW